jgi:hypothetical protein
MREFGRKGGYIVINQSTEIYAINFDGLPGILPRVQKILETSPEAELVYRSHDGEIFYVRSAANTFSLSALNAADRTAAARTR